MLRVIKERTVVDVVVAVAGGEVSTPLPSTEYHGTHVE